MARISLLFALAFVVAIGSVTAHAPINRRTQKNVCPSTLSEVQQFPSVEISKLIEKKALTGPNTLQFRTLFAVCKSYNDYLASIKFSAAKNVLGLVHAKYALVTKAMLAAQALVGVEGQLSVELSKSYTGMAKGYVSIVQTIAQLSAKYKFIASAEIRKSDRAKVEKCLSKLKAAIDVFVNVVSECSNKLTSEEKVGLPIKFRGGFIGKKSLGFRENFIGLGANGQVGGEVEAGVKLGGHAKVGAKVGAKAGAKVGAKAGAKVGAKAGAKVGAHVGAKVGAHVGAKVGAKAGVKVGAKGEVKVGVGAGAKAGGFLGGFLGLGGRVQYDAAGKAKIGGGSGFRSLTLPHEKHLN
ncbi:unnamed protein product [Microthlaspi erraticum]|uniref:Pectinesterase inhibitor domain-containing protein n=1 Tax=Microthlaspi erraticum TaxID=1685480 RepID=A0A6D2KC12_9BRAS|nr:unnamed protein product [Microthlaspi erraticum]